MCVHWKWKLSSSSNQLLRSLLVDVEAAGASFEPPTNSSSLLLSLSSTCSLIASSIKPCPHHDRPVAVNLQIGKHLDLMVPNIFAATLTSARRFFKDQCVLPQITIFRFLETLTNLQIVSCPPTPPISQEFPNIPKFKIKTTSQHSQASQPFQTPLFTVSGASSSLEALARRSRSSLRASLSGTRYDQIWTV